MPYQIQLRRGTATQWTAANPVLADGEMGIESDTRKVKIGDGSTAWNSLPYNLLGDIADDAVTTAKILNGAVTEAKLATNAVTNTKIANNAVTQAKLASTLSGITICTSSTRPTGFEGQIIYETDTDLVRAYDGTTWNLVGASSYAVASGGTTSSITASGVNYKLHTFTTSGTLTISTAGFVDIMAIGAGGGGHGTVNLPTQYGGGGGGAEIFLDMRRYMNAGTYSIVIGAGVAQGMGNRTYMNDNAFGFGVLAAQGGGSGSYVGGGVSYGGAGGGGGAYGGAYGGGTTIFGRGISRDGGQAAANAGGGGGGGLGGNGGNASGSTGGAGGNGADISVFLGQSAGTTIRCGGGGGGGNPAGANGTGTGAANTGGGNAGNGASGSTGFSGVFYVRSAP